MNKVIIFLLIISVISCSPSLQGQKKKVKENPQFIQTDVQMTHSEDFKTFYTHIAQHRQGDVTQQWQAIFGQLKDRSTVTGYFDQLFNTLTDSSLTAQECLEGLKKLARSLNFDAPNPKQFYQMFSYFDKNMNERIEREEFTPFVLGLLQKYAGFFYVEGFETQQIINEIASKDIPIDAMTQKIQHAYKSWHESEAILVDDSQLRTFFRSKFIEFDADSSWLLDKNELSNFIKAQLVKYDVGGSIEGNDIVSQYCDTFFNYFDINGNGFIDMFEFSDVCFTLENGIFTMVEGKIHAYQNYVALYLLQGSIEHESEEHFHQMG